MITKNGWPRSKMIFFNTLHIKIEIEIRFLISFLILIKSILRKDNKSIRNFNPNKIKRSSKTIKNKIMSLRTFHLMGMDCRH